MSEILPRLRWWVGIYLASANKREPRTAFSSRATPNALTHGHLFGATIGPYRTKRGAVYAAANRWVRSIAHAERAALNSAVQSKLAKEYARKL